jgi:hypothetical protein
MLAAANLPPHGPVQYSIIWLIIGLSLLVAVIGWYGFVIWFSRRRPKDLSGLLPLTDSFNLDALKAKYLQLVDQCYDSYVRQEVGRRELHRNLSITVRYFVYEANNFPAPRLTLSDLKHAPYPNLTQLIGNYYVDEFAAIETGEPLMSAQAAKGVIQQWV